MAEYYNVTTNLGDAEIANAIATNTKLNITHVAFGDGNGSVPTPTKTRISLVREVHRQAVTKYERHPTNQNWIVIETIIPSHVGGFTIREMGIIANGKLISHGSHAPFEKVADSTGVSEYRLKFTQNIKDGNVVSIILDESLIYATQAWVEEFFVGFSDIVDNLTTDDATKVASARTVKELQDNKLEATDLKDATTEQKGVAQIADVSDVLNGVDNTKIITPSLLAQVNFSSAIDVIDVTALRAKNTVYTNPYDHPIEVYVGTNKTSASVTLVIYLDEKEVHNLLNDGDGSCNCWATFTVRPHGEYRVNTSGVVAYWRERVSV